MLFTVNTTPMPPSPQIILPPILHSLNSSIYGLPYDLAMQYSGATVSERSVRRCVERFFERQELDNGVEIGGGYFLSSSDYLVPSPSSNTPGDTEPSQDFSTAPARICRTLPLFIINNTPWYNLQRFSNHKITKGGNLQTPVLDEQGENLRCHDQAQEKNNNRDE